MIYGEFDKTYAGFLDYKTRTRKLVFIALCKNRPILELLQKDILLASAGGFTGRRKTNKTFEYTRIKMKLIEKLCSESGVCVETIGGILQQIGIR